MKGDDAKGGHDKLPEDAVLGSNVRERREHLKRRRPMNLTQYDTGVGSAVSLNWRWLYFRELRL